MNPLQQLGLDAFADHATRRQVGEMLQMLRVPLLRLHPDASREQSTGFAPVKEAFDQLDGPKKIKAAVEDARTLRRFTRDINEKRDAAVGAIERAATLSSGVTDVIEAGMSHTRESLWGTIPAQMQLLDIVAASKKIVGRISDLEHFETTIGTVKRTAETARLLLHQGGRALSERYRLDATVAGGMVTVGDTVLGAAACCIGVDDLSALCRSFAHTIAVGPNSYFAASDPREFVRHASTLDGSSAPSASATKVLLIDREGSFLLAGLIVATTYTGKDHR